MNVHLGGMGIKVGQFIWEELCVENGIDNEGKYNFDPKLKNDGSTLPCYFRETSKGKYKPRTIFFDMEVDSIEYLKTKGLGKVFDEKCLMLGQQKVPGFYSSGYYTNGPAYLDAVLDYIRSEIETCDNFNGFMFYNSIVGGCSSGFGSLLSQVLTDEFANKRKIGFNLYPSITRTNNPTEYFNAILAHDR